MATVYKDATFGEVLNWTLLDDNASGTPYKDSGDVDISKAAYCMLHISMAQCNTTAIATQATAQVWGKSGTTHDDWNLITECPYGTTSSLVTDPSGINSGEYSMGTADTTALEGYGKRVFVKHSTLTSSIVATVVDFSNDSYIRFLNPAPADLSANITLYCPSAAVGGHGVTQWNVEVPDGFQVAKVSFHNPDDDANYAVRVQWTKILDYSIA